MSSADELIREAQYAFRNISHGSTDEKKYRARAEKYAKRVIRKYPTSIEASQARRILDQMNVLIDVRSQPNPPSPLDAAADFERSHSSDSGHTRKTDGTPPRRDAQFQSTSVNEDWRDILRRFAALPRNKKNAIGIVAAIAIFFPGGILLISGLVIYYALQTALLKKHLLRLLNRLES